MPTKTASSNGHAGEVSTLRAWALEAEAAGGIARALVDTEFIPDTLRRWLPGDRNQPRALDRDGTVQTVAAALLTGQELGFSPMASLRVIDIIRHTPALRAVGLRALLLAHGHEIVVVETTATRARVRARRAGTDQWQESVWTLDRAKQLGVYPGPPDGQWRRQPQSMLVARATAEVSRWIAADAMLGLPYISEEISDPDAEFTEEPAPASTAPASSTTATATATRKRKTATPRAALPAAPPPEQPEGDPPDAERDPPDAERITPPPPSDGTWGNPAPPPPPPVTTAPPDPGEPGTGDRDLITPAQQKRLHAQLRDAGITERTEALGLIGAWTGRDITTTNHLTTAEASQVIDRLIAIVRDERNRPDADE